MNNSFQGLNLGLDFDENILHNLISELCGVLLLVWSVSVYVLG